MIRNTARVPIPEGMNGVASTLYLLVALALAFDAALDGAAGTGVKLFFLGCVLVAGIYGALTASRKILFVQAVPAAIGLVLVLLSRP